jgi:hypothetical protein
MKPHLLAITLLMGSLLSLLPTALPTPTRAQSAERCFSETGYCISGRIREFWEQNGGLPVFGFPITPQQTETIEGQPLQVQWFERNRLELHPDNAPPYDVLLGRLGAEHVAQTGAPERDTPREGCRYFEETGFNVCGEVLSAWRAEGLEFDGQPGSSEAENLALFGLPLTGEFETTLADGNTYTVQWFERARFERHPENQTPYNVLLGLLGAEAGPVAQEQPAAPAAAPAGLLYSSSGQQYRVNLDTGTSEVIGAALPVGSIFGPGNTLIWVERGPEPEDWISQHPFRILQSNMDGSEQRVLLRSDNFYNQFARENYDFNLPPFHLVLGLEQQQLLFSASSAIGAPSYGYSHFFTLDLASGEVQEIGYAGIAGSGWIAPDGQGRVYTRRGQLDGAAAYPAVYVISGDPEAEQIMLTEDGGVADVVWLPDNHFIYTADGVVLANPQGETVQRLAELSEDVYAPWVAVSPDQQQVAYLVKHTDDAMSLWLVNLDGSGLRQVMDLPGDVTDLIWH